MQSLRLGRGTAAWPMTQNKYVVNSGQEEFGLPVALCPAVCTVMQFNKQLLMRLH